MAITVPGFDLQESSATSDGQTTFDFTDPKNQVPAPPTVETVDAIKKLLSSAKKTLSSLSGGFVSGKSYNGNKFASQQAFDSFKNDLATKVTETLPQQIDARKKWEDDYQIKAVKSFAPDEVLYSATDVFKIQQLHKEAGNYNDPEIKAYTEAIKVTQLLESKFDDPNSKESKLPKSEQQLALAAAWRVVQSTVTEKVAKLRSANYPLAVDMWGDVVKKTDFQTVSEIPKIIKTVVDTAIKEKDAETTVQQPTETDKYGRVISQTGVRGSEDSALYGRFKDRVNSILTADPMTAKATVTDVIEGRQEMKATTATGTPGTTAAAATSPVATASQRGGRGLTQAESKAAATGRSLATETGVMEPVIPSGGGGGGVPAKAKRDDVIAGLAALKLPDTAANRQTVRDQIKSGKLPGGGGAAGFDTGWQDRFKKEYPAYSWMLTELDQTKYADLFQLMNDAVKPGSEYTDELFQRKFIGTSWYTELAAGETGRALTTAVGSYSWGEGQLAKFLTTATRYGYKDATLKSKAYEALFAKDTATGNYINPAAIGEVKASSQFLAIKKIGTAFLSPVSDDSVINTLIGGKSSDDILRIARESAKVKFPHLSNAIDAGVTLEDLGYQYQQNAAKLLEVAPNAIDMGSTIYAKAFGSSKDPMMSTGEWEAYLKGNPDAGWQYTKQANQQATDIGLTLARAFGKVQ